MCFFVFVKGHKSHLSRALNKGQGLKSYLAICNVFPAKLCREHMLGHGKCLKKVRCRKCAQQIFQIYFQPPLQWRTNMRQIIGMRMNEGAVRMGDNSFSHSSPLAIRWDCFYIFYNFQNCFLKSPKVIPNITQPHNNNFQILISSLENPPLNSFY